MIVLFVEKKKRKRRRVMCVQTMFYQRKEKTEMSPYKAREDGKNRRNWFRKVLFVC